MYVITTVIYVQQINFQRNKVQVVSQLLKQSDWAQIQDFK